MGGHGDGGGSSQPRSGSIRVQWRELGVCQLHIPQPLLLWFGCVPNVWQLALSPLHPQQRRQGSLLCCVLPIQALFVVVLCFSPCCFQRLVVG